MLLFLLLLSLLLLPPTQRITLTSHLAGLQDGGTALQRAALNGHLEMVVPLLHAGAAVNAADEVWLPLHHKTAYTYMAY
jgi:hypothetical protein